MAAIHNACIGGGVDLVSTTDMRYCTKDAWFQLKETEIGKTLVKLYFNRLISIKKCVGSN